MKTKILATIVTLFTIGCGGGGGGAQEQTGGQTMVATFIDSPVAGLEFHTPTLSGVTDENGNFIYNDGEIVTFFIGSLQVGSAKPKEGKVTPLDVIGVSDKNDDRVVRILQTLQTLDSDGDASNGITIPQSAIETLRTRPAINLSSRNVKDEDVLAVIGLEQFNVTKTQAKDHFNLSMPSNSDKPYVSQAAGLDSRYILMAWNDLGMHCADGKDYSVFSILPPYNNLHAHLIDKSVATNKNTHIGVTLTYEAVADSSGSINSSSVDKTNFWDFVYALFGKSLAKNLGLNLSEPLVSNPAPSLIPFPLKYNAAQGFWEAEGIPITPYDDSGAKNYYPMVKVVAKDKNGVKLAETKTVLPVSDEMSCKACHASNVAMADARPSGGWVNDSDLEKDWKKNILKLHDEKHPNAISVAGMDGIYKNGTLSATANAGQPILCAACHKSNALGTAAKPGITSLTQALHSKHANTKDPSSGATLESSSNRTSCYLCHPGSETNCLRGVMGAAKTQSDVNVMNCQDCHGSMSVVGSSSREGWLDQPGCWHCHDKSLQTGEYVRYTSVFSSGATLRSVIDSRFAANQANPNAVAPLYKNAKGHGSLRCEACHGSTHAEYPSSHVNDNVQSLAIQGHVGTIAECSACHTSTPMTVDKGPHGMHTVGQTWVNKHGDYAKKDITACKNCHGADYRGSITSKTWTVRSFKVENKTKTYAHKQAVGCYDCHNGPNKD